MPNTYEDEIDLFELFEAIWDGKWIVSFTMLMTTLAGFAFLPFYEEKYEAKLHYYLDTIPPFYDDEKIFFDFEKSYTQKVNLKIGKKIMVLLGCMKTLVQPVVDGFVLSQNRDVLLGSINSSKDGIASIVIRSQQLAILDDFFQYTNHINDVLKNEYVLRARDELNMIQARFKDLGPDAALVNTVLISIDTLYQLNRGEMFLR